ncbi:zinc finger MYM-type protein 4-like [Uloborus diversus]|uniref:zinc finger MYM-type protein 4-like n=1 Tax=Uloborus diversus TaxID=327109 RepID=UPI002409B7CC|nr:zinc finger MYM-type protein 4-like [Uloborus diversus]
MNQEAENSVNDSKSGSANVDASLETEKKKSSQDVKKGLKFQVLFQGKTRFLCSDTCFKNFKTKQKKPAEPVKPTELKCAHCEKVIEDNLGYYPVIGEIRPLCSEECIKKYHDVYAAPKKCSQCKKVLDDAQNFDILTWETMLFCNEDCLGKYQSFLGSHCTCCQTPVQQASLGKYCVCFGADIRQFCSGSCLEEFKKGLKVCSFCQTDLSAGTEGFLAPVGDKGQFKDFCSQRCMERYEMVNNIGSKTPPETQDCAFCKKQGVYRIQMKHNDKTVHLCCDLCVAGFRCAMQLKEDICDTCYTVFKLKPGEDFSFKLDGMHRHFCKKACMTLFVLSHRKIVPCVWCKVKKYNFDMIEKIDAINQSQMFCSLNCLSLYRVSLSATSAKSIRCDNCTKNLPAQYHLTMSDGSIRNFCTYPCVLNFQNQFTNVPALTTSSTTRQTSATTILKTTSTTSSPVISNVMSLASPRPSTPVTSIAVNKLVPQKLIPVRQQSPIVISSKSLGVSSTITSPSVVSTAAGPGGPQIIREVIVKPPAPKSVKNKTVSCKPIMQTKGISCKPHPCHKAVQTDESPRSIILPIPVPIYIPTPMHMFSRPVPCPVPFPVPIPIPIIVPTSKETPSQVIEHLKDIQEKTPSNPLEAEMLMMAELVAEDGSQNDNAIPEPNLQNEAPPKNSQDASSKTAVENSEVEVLEEPPSLEIVEEAQNNDKEESEPEDEYVFKEAKSHRKRTTTSSHGKRRKKSRLSDAAEEESSFRGSTEIDTERNNAKETEKHEAAPPLKPILGVNAWKDWVLKKNSEMMKGPQSSRKFKQFKTDLLQLSTNELDFSLSIFVQEVRREDGDEYTPGSLFYLLLGIQRFLFDNGRIDNIFTDPYYEKFTECLNNILCRQDAVYALEACAAEKEAPTKATEREKEKRRPDEYEKKKRKLDEEEQQQAIEKRIMPSSIHEEYLWEAKQLGAHSPHVLLNTLMYFNTKYFKLRKVEDHFRFSFTHVTKIKVRDFDSHHAAEEGKKVLRYYPPINRDYSRCSSSEIDVYEQVESTDALRCPVKLYEFYLSKCPESVKARNDIFYLYPERSCVPDSPVWYSTQPLGQEVIAKMIQRIKFVKGIYK